MAVTYYEVLDNVANRKVVGVARLDIAVMTPELWTGLAWEPRPGLWDGLIGEGNELGELVPTTRERVDAWIAEHPVAPQ